MPWKRVGRGTLVLASLLALAAAAALDFEFYTPAVGEIAAGDEQEAKPEVPRDRAVVSVERFMAADPRRGVPTLADVVRFHGLEEDAIECTVQELHGEAASPGVVSALARRPLRPGDEVTVCLD